MILVIPKMDLYPYSTQATNHPNRHELIFLSAGIREVSLFISPIVMFYESVPIQRIFGGISAIRLESRKNSLRLAK